MKKLDYKLHGNVSSMRQSYTDMMRVSMYVPIEKEIQFDECSVLRKNKKVQLEGNSFARPKHPISTVLKP